MLEENEPNNEDNKHWPEKHTSPERECEFGLQASKAREFNRMAERMRSW